MLNRLTDLRLNRVMAAALAAAAVLAGCDQIGERMNRAKDIAETSGGQISGETVVDQSARNLETAATADRALAGTVMAEFAVEDDERPLFAIGSIIAKPIDIPPTEALAVEDAAYSAEELEYFEEEYYYEEEAGAGAAAGDSPEAAAPPPSTPEDATSREPAGDVVQMEQVLPKITIDPRMESKTEKSIADAGADVNQMVIDEPPMARKLKRMTREEFKDLPVEEKAEIRKLARRAPVVRETLKAQIDANSVMADTMSKYNIGGNVALSREGQMVIQIGPDAANPTQFKGPVVDPAAFLVRADQAECPEGVEPADVGGDLALTTACMVRDLRASGQFEYVEPDFIFQNQFVRRNKDAPKPSTGTGSSGSTATPPSTTAASYNPNDPLWALQWHFRDRGTTDGRTAGGAGFESFWNRQGTTGSRSVVVAVVDTGLQMAHPDIASSPNIMPGWDMVSDTRMGNDGDGRDSDANDPGDMCDPTKPYAADSFHGTHVAGTVGAAATNNGSGVAGGAWNVRIVPVRALGKCGGRLSDINDAIRWAAGLIPAEGPGATEVWNENPADVINLSIGLLGACPASLQDAIDSVTERGAIVVSAAGNARMSTSFYAPAGCRNVVTVAASDARGQLTPYSNFGPEVTLLAPGGDLTRDDNGDGKPDGVLSTKAASNCYDPVTGASVDTCYYAYEQGTSMAAPHVSAALALLKARSPSATKDELIATLRGALDPRQPLQCSGLCSQYPGTTPLPGNPDMCARPCGAGLLNLAAVPAAPAGGGGR